MCTPSAPLVFSVYIHTKKQEFKCAPLGVQTLVPMQATLGVHICTPSRGAQCAPLHGVHTCTLWGAYLYPYGVLICTLQEYLFVPYGVHICNAQGAYMHPQWYRPLSLYKPPQGFTSAPYIGVHTRTLYRGAHTHPMGCLFVPFRAKCLYAPLGVQTLVPIQATLGVQICTLNKGAHMHL